MLSIVLSCERDDICADVVITPRAIIRFTEFADPDNFDDVFGLQIQYIPDEGEVLEENFNANVFDISSSADSITLSLPTTKDTARFRFIQNFDLDENDEEDLSDAEIDIVEFTYTRTNEYVNRACGFKTVFSDLQVRVLEDIENEDNRPGFILGRNVINETIEDEEAAHIHILH